MPGLKCTAFFEQSRVNTNTTPNINVGLGTWTETYYAALSMGEPALEKFVALLRKRLALCSPQTYVNKIRLQQVLPTGRTISRRVELFGSAAGRCDDPEQALSWLLASPLTSNTRVLTLRGTPDARVEGGYYNRTPAYTTAVRQFFEVLTETDWRFRGKDKSGAKAKIDTIDAVGNVQTLENIAPDLSDLVQVIRSMAAGHRQKGATSRILTITDARNLKIATWPHGASTGGTIRIVKPDDLYELFLAAEERDRPTVRVRQTGSRPSGASRGRRSAKYA